jgi:hypothetical protein
MARIRTLGSFVRVALRSHHGSFGSSQGGSEVFEPSGQYVVGSSDEIAKHNIDVEVQLFSTSVFGLARVNTNGSLDSSFGGNGTVLTTIQGDEGA